MRPYGSTFHFITFIIFLQGDKRKKTQGNHNFPEYFYFFFKYILAS